VNRLTFKKQPRSEIGYSQLNPDVDIKCDGLVVGTIAAPRVTWPERKGWEIRFMFKQDPTPTNPAPFKWGVRAIRFPTEEEARADVAAQWERLSTSGRLYKEPKG